MGPPISSERWRRVEGIYHAALNRPFPERSAFLAAACAGDDDLRREVESLLAQTSALSDHFLGEPALRVGPATAADAPSTSLIGERIGHYHILSRLGAGGMGEVYRARDTKLGRDVAIKILPPAFTSDPERLARFRREAQVLASLNHPHIAAIYGLEDTGGVHALVLELVDGQTLADRLCHGPVPLKEAHTIAAQLVVALEAAHEKGIVHRDLKPANIQITPEGAVKVLDFGLAKAATTDAGTADRMHAPTGTIGATREGVVLGTAAYMSPEQARGLRVDKRTDIWAFGCVLYEMLTGRVAFAGRTVSDTVAAILQREPDWTALPTGTPPSVRRLLRRTLEKDFKRRLRDMGDAQLELEDVPNDGVSPEPTTRRLPQSWIWGLAVVLIVLALGWIIVDLRRQVPEARTVTLSVNPPAAVEFRAAGEGGGSAISPSGRLLAFVARHPNGVSRLWIRPLNSRTARELPGTDDAHYPFWSPVTRQSVFSRRACFDVSTLLQVYRFRSATSLRDAAEHGTKKM